MNKICLKVYVVCLIFFIKLNALTKCYLSWCTFNFGLYYLDLSFITPFILISRLIQEQKRKHESLSVNPSMVHNMTWDKYYNFDEVKHMNRFFWYKINYNVTLFAFCLSLSSFAVWLTVYSLLKLAPYMKLLSYEYDFTKKVHKENLPKINNMVQHIYSPKYRRFLI